jgi:hypothetical protein
VGREMQFAHTPGPPCTECSPTFIPPTRLNLGQTCSGSSPVKITRDNIGKFCSTTLSNAALALGVSPAALKEACLEIGVPRWPPAAPIGAAGPALQDSFSPEHSIQGAAACPRSAPRGMCIIKKEQAVEIFKARDVNRKKQDKLCTRLSAQYGISTKAVRDIWNLRTWSHVTKPFWTSKDARRMLLSRLCVACKQNSAIGSIADACDECQAPAMAVNSAAQGAAVPPSVLIDAWWPRSSNANYPTLPLEDGAAEPAASAIHELTAWGFRPPADFGARWSVEASKLSAYGASASSAACDLDETGGIGPSAWKHQANGVSVDGADITAFFAGIGPGDGTVPRSAAPVELSTATDSYDIVRKSCPEHVPWLTPPPPTVAFTLEEEGALYPGRMCWLTPTPSAVTAQMEERGWGAAMEEKGCSDAWPEQTSRAPTPSAVTSPMEEKGWGAAMEERERGCSDAWPLSDSAQDEDCTCAFDEDGDWMIDVCCEPTASMGVEHGQRACSTPIEAVGSQPCAPKSVELYSPPSSHSSSSLFVAGNSTGTTQTGRPSALVLASGLLLVIMVCQTLCSTSHPVRPDRLQPRSLRNTLAPAHSLTSPPPLSLSLSLSLSPSLSTPHH